MNEPDQDQVRCPECGKLHAKNLITFAWHQFQERMREDGYKGVRDERSFAHGFMCAVFLVKAIEENTCEPLTDEMVERLTAQAVDFEAEIEAP